MQHLKLILNIILNLINKYIKVIIILLLLLLLLCNQITVLRLFYFILIIVMIILYKYLFNIIDIKNNYLKELFLNKININYYDKILLGLIKLSAINNIILFIIPFIEIKVFNFIKVINCYIQNNKIKNVLILILVNLTSPLKIVISKFYKMLNMFNSLTIFEILFKRMYGLILSVLIFTNILNALINMCNGRINLLIYIYIFLLMISIAESVNYTFRSTQIININKILDIIITNKNLIFLWGLRESVSVLYKLIKVLLNLKNNDKNNFLFNYYEKFNLELIVQFSNLNKLEKVDSINLINFKNWYKLEKLQILNNKIYRGLKGGVLSTAQYIKYNSILYNYYFELIFLLSNIIEVLPELFYIKYQTFNKMFDIKQYNYILAVYILINKILIYTITYIEEYVGTLNSNLLLNKFGVDEDSAPYYSLDTTFFLSFEEFYSNIQKNNKFFDLDKNQRFYEAIYVLGHIDEVNYLKFQKSFKFIELVFKSKLSDSESMDSIRGSRYGCSTSEMNQLVKNDLLNYKNSLVKEYNESKNKEELIKSLLNELLNLQSYEN